MKGRQSKYASCVNLVLQRIELPKMISSPKLGQIVLSYRLVDAHAGQKGINSPLHNPMNCLFKRLVKALLC